MNAAKTSRLAVKNYTDLWDSDSTEEATIRTVILELASREEGRKATARTIMSGNTRLPMLIALHLISVNFLLYVITFYDHNFLLRIRGF